MADRDPVAILLEEHERRLGIIEHKLDRLTDAQTGVYPLLERTRVELVARLDAHQKSLARLVVSSVAFLTAVITVVATIVSLIHRGL